MQLPGRLKDTTLGDVLGTLFRARVTGTLELVELSGPTSGRVHSIVFHDGVIARIEPGDAGSRLGDILDIDVSARRRYSPEQHLRIGEYLVDAGIVTADRLRTALYEQLQARLEQIYRLADARLSFRPPRPASTHPTDPRPLGQAEFLDGRPRKRRGEAAQSRAGRAPGQLPEHEEALRVLGLGRGASQADVQTAFRRLARESHPDTRPGASDSERRELLRRFATLSRAYHRLLA
jgi:DnaJ-domain-containing protein 1